MLWTVARNASDRPTLQHAVNPTGHSSILCDPNRDWSGWSRSYTSQPIPSVACKKCLRITGVIANPVRAQPTPLRSVS